MPDTIIKIDDDNLQESKTETNTITRYELEKTIAWADEKLVSITAIRKDAIDKLAILDK